MAWIIIRVFMEQKTKLFHRIQSVFQQKIFHKAKGLIIP